MKRFAYWLVVAIVAGGFYFYKQGQVNQVESFNAAMELMDDGEYDKAITVLEGARKRDPEEVRILDALAYCYQEVGNYAEAVSTNKQILELDPDNETAQDRLAELSD